MTQTQPQRQPPAHPEPQVTGTDPALRSAGSAHGVEHPTPPTYQQIEASGTSASPTASSLASTSAPACSTWPRTTASPLERAKFLAIFSELLDEFYQIRVAALEDQVAAGVRTRSVDGLRPGEQLTMIRARVEELVRREDHIFLDLIVPALAEAGVRFASWSSLDDDDRQHLVEVFQRQIYPVLTPLAVDPGHPFPYISNLSLNLVVEVQDPVTGEGRIARVKVRRPCPASSSCPTASASSRSSRSSPPIWTRSSRA